MEVGASRRGCDAASNTGLMFADHFGIYGYSTWPFINGSASYAHTLSTPMADQGSLDL